MFYRVNTIYPAYMGEVNCMGIGHPCTFVRLSGCNLRCYFKTKGGYCDTPEALSMKEGKAISTNEIALKTAMYGNDLVCLTGGEPLMQDCTELLEKLTKMNMHVAIETNGSMAISPYRHIQGISFVMDWKAPSTGEIEKMLESNLKYLDEDDFVKFVIDDDKDFDAMVKFYRRTPTRQFNIAVGLFWGSKLTYTELMKKISAENINVYLNCQEHKMCMLYDKYKDSLSDVVIPREL